MPLTEGRKVQQRAGDRFGATVAAGVTVFAGALIALKAGVAIPAREGVGADNAAKATEVATHFVAGVAEETTQAGDNVPYRSGCFLFDNKSDDLVTRSDIGKPCYAVDDHTVGKTSPNNVRAKAGTVVDVESIGVWVRVGA